MPFNHNPYFNEYQEMDERAEQEFNTLLSSSRSTYTIPRSAFDGYRVKRGLREADGTGVMAGVTRVGSAHGYVVSEGDKYPVEGVLEYRGYDLRDLIHNFAAENRFGFEETTFLLFFGHLPTREELAEFNDLLATLRRLPPRFTEDIIMKAPSRSIMNKLQSSVLALYAYDDNPDEVTLDNMLRQSIEIVARLPVIAAQSYSVYRNAFFNKSLTLHNPTITSVPPRTSSASSARIRSTPRPRPTFWISAWSSTPSTAAVTAPPSPPVSCPPRAPIPIPPSRGASAR